MPYNYLFLLILGSAILIITEGCGRSPATPKPTDPPTTTVATHKIQCTENETTSAACLNGGTCFVLLLPERTTFCQCNSIYSGKRCQFINPEISFQEEPKNDTATAGIAASAVAATLFVVVVLCIVIVHKRYKRKKKKEESKKLHNGLLSTLDNTNTDHVNDQNSIERDYDDNDSIQKNGARCLIDTATDIESCV